VVFSVDKSWKGIRSKTAEIYYNDGGDTSCRFSLIKGEKYSFFAMRDKNRLFVSECSAVPVAGGPEKYLGRPLKLKN
jgi:hypothetical protein